MGRYCARWMREFLSDGFYFHFEAGSRSSVETEVGGQAGVVWGRGMKIRYNY